MKCYTGRGCEVGGRNRGMWWGNCGVGLPRYQYKISLEGRGRGIPR